MLCPRRTTLLPLVAALLTLSCQPKPPSATQPSIRRGAMFAVRLSEAEAVPLDTGTAELESARNEVTSFAVQLSSPDPDRTRRKYWLRFQPLKSGENALDVKQITLYQALPLPADTNRAAYVRQTGLPTTPRRFPTALLPITADSKGRFQLTQVRDNDNPAKPADPKSVIKEAVLLYADLAVPAEAAAGTYEGSLQLVHDDWGDKVDATVPIRLTVHDFVLPDERHLLMVGPVAWESLYNRWPGEFEAITPRLLNRDEAKHAGAVRVLDELVKEGQRHRVQVVCQRLQPTVKWAPGLPPQFDWLDYDTVVGPYLSGEAFADKVPVGYWPLPKIDQLDRYDRSAQAEYWKGCAAHFDQRGWLAQSPVVMDAPASRFAEARVRAVGQDAGDLLRAHSRIRVVAPISSDLLPVSERPTAGRVDITDAGRVIAYAPGLVHGPSVDWPAAFAAPRRYLAVGQSSPTPYVGAGQSERDVRQWAYLAFLQRAEMVVFGEPIPKEANPTEPVSADEQVWFYPGQWFGVDGVLPTLQLKWARTAAQDFEYLYLARLRGESASPELVARLLSRPVETGVSQAADPAYSMVTGTADPGAWEDARRLIAHTISLRRPGQAADPRLAQQLQLETINWTTPRARPTVMVRDVRWSWSQDAGRNTVDARVGVDLYLATHDDADKNTVGFTSVPAGWQIAPRPVTIGPLASNKITRVELPAKFDLDRAGVGATAVSEVTFTGTGGFTREPTAARFVLPVGVSDRRDGALKLDGLLADWNPADAIQDSALVRMLDRRAVQSQQLRKAETVSTIYTAWAEDSFYVAFKLDGVAHTDLRASRNFVDYQDRRAWGEDLCEVLLQAVYTDGATGPAVHVVCKPNGQWVERKPPGLVPAGEAGWSPAPEGVLYANQLSAPSTWRGELSIPWRLLNDPRRGRPTLLRFNFGQHKSSTGESSTWAGPTDSSRDDQLTGLLLLRDNVR